MRNAINALFANYHFFSNIKNRKFKLRIHHFT